MGSANPIPRNPNFSRSIMASFDLSSKFPDLRPIQSLPPLRSIGGCGFMMYGPRDLDADTNSHVRTHWFCLFYMPILALGAYRIAAIRGGWYFLGRVPLTRQATLWNGGLAATVLLVGSILGWTYYTHTPGYLARCKLAEADRLAAAGQPGKAAQLCREVALENLESAPAATEKVKQLLDGPFTQVAPEAAAGLFEVAVELRHYRGAPANLPSAAWRW
jgi:hypothetical protein